MKIGIFIGCFNPVHRAHIECAKELLKMLDKIIFVPVGDEYEKSGLVEANHRLEMLRLATGGEKRFLISTLEIESGKLYTYQTLDHFKEKFPNDEIVLIIGTDNLKEFYWWKENQYILDNYRIIVLTRNGVSKKDFPEYADKNLEFVESNKPVSSTRIRQLLADQNYAEAEQFLDADVFKYIRDNDLFK